MTQKIIICGFPHSGTSILKSIICHCDDVKEIYNETITIHEETDKPFILCKYPFTMDTFFSHEYEDYIKIFIIRNPLFVFSSLNKRFNYTIPDNHSINQYIKTIQLFVKYKNHKNVYTIKYEDMFENNYQEIKNILERIGIQYTDDIFDNSKYTNVHYTYAELVSTKPKPIEHATYRTWQINQPFISNNDINHIDLSENQKQELMHDDILHIYPDICKYFEK
jgi:hypothetical protein